MSGNDSKPGLTRRDLGAFVAGAVAVPQAVAQTPARAPAPAGPVLEIADWSYRWYGVEHAKLARGTVCNGMQMYAEHWTPAEVRHPYPVVLIHGGYGQGSEWISTPDGRRGWATQLLEQGFQVYVVDRPGQGRCPYHPYAHGAFDREAPTFERAAVALKGPQGEAHDPAVVQYLAALGQPMANNAITQEVWRTRGALLLDDIGPSILITHGDGAVFAQLTAQERPKLVKGIVAVQPATPPTPRGGIPTAVRDNREELAPIVAWIASNVEMDAAVSAAADPHPNKESTSLRLADQGGFFVGVQRKTMPYGTIALGQMFVQYMIPAAKRHPYPVVMVHGGGGQGTHMMGLGGRPGWVHYFVQAGYSVYWLDRPSYGRSPYHPDALGPSHLPNVPPIEGLIQSTGVFNTAQWPGPGGMNDLFIDQFMACEAGNVTDEAFHSELAWRGGVELLERIGPSILFTHAFGGFFGWGVADRRPDLVKAIMCMEINGNPFAAQLRWGLTAAPITYDPPVTDVSQFQLTDHTEPPDSPRPVVATYKLQAEPAHLEKPAAHPHRLADERMGRRWLASGPGGVSQAGRLPG